MQLEDKIQYAIKLLENITPSIKPTDIYTELKDLLYEILEEIVNDS